MDKRLFHSTSVNLFRDKVYNNIFTINDIKSDEKVMKIRVSSDESVVYKGFEIPNRKTKQTMFVPSETDDHKKIHEVMPIKIIETIPVTYGRRVFHYTSKFKTLNFPKSDEMSMKEFLDSWFPLEHTDPDSVFIAKIAVLTSAVDRGFSRLISEKGFGKDGIADNLQQITNCGTIISEASNAKLYQLIESGFAVFNEIAGLGGESKYMFQRFFLDTGDKNKLKYEHPTTGSDRTGNGTADISKFGWCVMHNIPEYYIARNQETFEQMFQEAVYDRVFPLSLKGQVKPRHNFMNVTWDFKSIVDEGMNDYSRWIGKFYYLKEHTKEYQLKHDLSRYDLTVPGRKEAGSRFYNTFCSMAKIVEQYDYDRFYENMDKIFMSNREYVEKVVALGLI